MNNDVMECTRCNYKIADGDKFCLRCGEETFKTPGTSGSSQSGPAPRDDIWEVLRAPAYKKTTSTSTGQRRKKAPISKNPKNKLILAIILLALLGTGGVLGYLFWETIAGFLPFFG